MNFKHVRPIRISQLTNTIPVRTSEGKITHASISDSNALGINRLALVSLDPEVIEEGDLIATYVEHAGYVVGVYKYDKKEFTHYLVTRTGKTHPRMTTEHFLKVVAVHEEIPRAFVHDYFIGRKIDDTYIGLNQDLTIRFNDESMIQVIDKQGNIDCTTIDTPYCFPVVGCIDKTRSCYKCDVCLLDKFMDLYSQIHS